MYAGIEIGLLFSHICQMVFRNSPRTFCLLHYQHSHRQELGLHHLQLSIIHLSSSALFVSIKAPIMEILSPTPPNREPEECVALGLTQCCQDGAKGGNKWEKQPWESREGFLNNGPHWSWLIGFSLQRPAAPGNKPFMNPHRRYYN